MKDSSVNGHNTVIVAVPIIHQFKVSNRVSTFKEGLCQNGVPQ